MPFGIDDVIGIGAGLYGAYQGNQQQKKANNLQQQGLAQAQQQYDQRAPFRALGAQQLGHIEAPHDMGNLGYNPTNPFAAARGPTRSNAYITGTQNNTFQAPPEQTMAEQQSSGERQALTAMLANPQTPGPVRKQAEQRLAALGTAPAQSPATYGFR